MFNKIFVLSLFVAVINCAKLPSEYPKCTIGDGNCVRRTAQNVIDSISKNGDYKKLHLPQLNPFRAERISLKQGSDSPVNIELNLKSVDVYGLNTITVKKIEGFERGFNKPIIINFSTPQIKFHGNYTIDGRVLVVPIVGDGLCNLILSNLDGAFKLKVKLVANKGKEYIKIQNFKIKFDISRLELQFDNLYNGNKVLSDNTNLFLNENWRDIFEELKENIYDAVGQVLVGVADGVLSKYSYSELFNDDQYKKA